MAVLRIMVVDDHEIVRRGVKSLLESNSGWQVVGEAAEGLEAVETAAKLRPDVIVLDYNLPGLDGVNAGRRILDALPHTEVLILSYDDSPFVVRRALECGIRGYVLKSDAGHDLLAGVAAVSEHKVFLSSRVSKELPDGTAGSPGVNAEAE
jgi:DNA-binding NarL/FixJ family response regulator